MAVSRRILIAAVALVVIAGIVVGIVVSTRGVGGAPGAAASTPATSTSASAAPTAGTGGSSPSASATAGTGGSGSGSGGGTGTATPAATADPGSSSGEAQRPVALQGTATVVPAVTAKITSMAAVTGKSGGVGEISGPALRFTITVSNGTAKTVDLSSTVVTVTYGTAKTPSDEIATARKNFPASVKAKATAAGTFTFTIPKAQRKDVRITLDYGVSAPSAVFAGTAPQ